MLFFFGVLYFFKASILFKTRMSAFLLGVCSVAVCSLLSSDVVLRETIYLALIGGKSLKRLLYLLLNEDL